MRRSRILTIPTANKDHAVRPNFTRFGRPCDPPLGLRACLSDPLLRHYALQSWPPTHTQSKGSFNMLRVFRHWTPRRARCPPRLVCFRAGLLSTQSSTGCAATLRPPRATTARAASIGGPGGRPAAKAPPLEALRQSPPVAGGKPCDGRLRAGSTPGIPAGAPAGHARGADKQSVPPQRMAERDNRRHTTIASPTTTSWLAQPHAGHVQALRRDVEQAATPSTPRQAIHRASLRAR